MRKDKVMVEQQEIDLNNHEFQNAWKLISYTRRSVFLTGKAGTGKSTFLRHICKSTKKKYVVLAPTGIAAVNVGGMTMHSFFRIPFKPMLPDDPDLSVSRIRQRLKYPKSLVKLIKKLELIIIDEISMVRADIIDFMDKVLRVYSENMREPFGGKQLLLVGDIFQLEPVVTADMRDILKKYYPNSFFFNARAFSEFSVVPIELRKVYRQSDGEFISMLDRVRLGKPTTDDILRLNSRVDETASNNVDGSRMVMTIATRRDMVDAINDTCLDRLLSPEITYRGRIKGDFPEASLPTSVDLTLKEGAQVVFVKNDRDHRWVNGTIGKISIATKQILEVELENGNRHTLEPEIWSNVQYSYDEETNRVVEKELGSFTQYPLKLAWALTVHKSQGLTFNNVIVDIGRGAFSSGQSYVALSRCRSFEGMTLRSTLNERDIFVNNSIIEFSKTFNNDSLIDGALKHAYADDCYRQSSEAFDKMDIPEAVAQFVNAVNSRNELTRKEVVKLLQRKLSIIPKQSAEIDRLREQLADNAKRFETLAREYTLMGDDCVAEGMDMTPAIANYDKAISLSPDFIPAWYGKGMALIGVGEIVDAIECMKYIYEKDVSNSIAPYKIGEIYLKQGELYEALNWFLAALNRNEIEPSIHKRIAVVYDKIGDEELADRHRILAKKYQSHRRRSK